VFRAEGRIDGPVGERDGGRKKRGKPREYIGAQSRRRRTTGNEEGDSAEKEEEDMGATGNDSVV